MIVKKPIILITGITGFIGKYLAPLFELKGYNVVGLIRPSSKLKNSYSTIIYDGTINSILNGMNQYQIEGIIHLATKFIINHKPEDIEEIINSNITLGNQLLECCNICGIKYFVNVATYAQSIDNSMNNPQNLYAASKNAFEAISKYYNESTPIKTATLEITDTYGPNDPRPKFINIAIEKNVKNEVLKMSPGKQEISYLFINDVTDAFLIIYTLLKKESITSGCKYSIFSNEIITLEDVVKKIELVTGKKTVTQKGFYSYRNREIMKYRTNYPLLPTWKQKISLEAGIKKIIKSYENTTS